MASEARAAAVPQTAEWAASRIALIGNPNTGKTTVFNKLCGARAKTSNFPGTTTSTRIGRGRLHEHREVADALVAQIAGVEAGERSILVLHHEEDIEHADDPALDEVDEQRHGLAGHRRVRRISDHHDVDRAQLVLVGFHPHTSSSRESAPVTIRRGATRRITPSG